ncbi:hypothetical protein BGZ58_008068 [Dissophora ornata]|nr:hypothetical protein BGZ58_008068 [Dissophora ornata]
MATTNETTDSTVALTTTHPVITTTTEPVTTTTQSLSTSATLPPITTATTTAAAVTTTTTTTEVTTTEATTTEEPTTVQTITTIPVTRTTEPPPSSITTVPPFSSKHVSTTTPYTTHYVTTISYVTVTTVVPKTTVVSGRGTTIYVTETTTTPTQTVIPDPNQAQPGTYLDTNNSGDGMKTWQITLIIVACLVVSMAVGAVCLVGWLKKRRRNRDRESMYSDGFGTIGGRGESVLGSEFTESGRKSNRTLVAPAVAGGDGGGQGRWSAMFRFRRPWDSLGVYHNAQRPEGTGGHWLMEDGNNTSYEGSVVAAAMYPVSYQNDPSAPSPYGGIAEEPFMVATGQPMVEVRHAHHQDQLQNAAVASSRASPVLTHPSNNDSASATTAPSSPCLLQPFIEDRLSTESSGYADGNSMGFSRQASQRQSHDIELLSDPQRESHDWTSAAGSRMGSARETMNIPVRGHISVSGSEGGEQSTNRTTIVVDPDQLEANAIFEHFRKGPQALPISSSEAGSEVEAIDESDNTVETEEVLDMDAAPGDAISDDNRPQRDAAAQQNAESSALTSAEVSQAGGSGTVIAAVEGLSITSGEISIPPASVQDSDDLLLEPLERVDSQTK